MMTRHLMWVNVYRVFDDRDGSYSHTLEDTWESTGMWKTKELAMENIRGATAYVDTVPIYFTSFPDPKYRP